MAASLRRRHAPEQVEDPEYTRFLEKYYSVVSPNHPYGNASSRSLGRLISIASAFAMVLIIVIATKGENGSSGTQQNLVLVTFYPQAVSSRVNEYVGQTELLVTDENRDVVDAIRTTIAMENNLKDSGKFTARNRRRRKRGIVGILLSIANWIASFRDLREENNKDFIAGEVVLKSLDYRGMREYLADHGSRCFEVEGRSDAMKNSILHIFDNLVNRNEGGIDNNKPYDASWNRAVQICAWCLMVNGDARGYIEHGTKINLKYSSNDLNSILEDARISGAGIALKQTKTRDLSHHIENYLLSPIFVLPADIDGNSTPDSTMIAKGVLTWLIEFPSNIPFPNEAPRSLLKLFSRKGKTLYKSTNRRKICDESDAFLCLDSKLSSAEASSSIR